MWGPFRLTLMGYDDIALADRMKGQYGYRPPVPVQDILYLALANRQES